MKKSPQPSFASDSLQEKTAVTGFLKELPHTLPSTACIPLPERNNSFLHEPNGLTNSVRTPGIHRHNWYRRRQPATMET